ncbi:DNA/RNA polymerase, partial [Dendrothele bispora CBS 962.96]
QIEEEEKAGRFEPTVSSYRSSMFPVAKKNGVQLVVNLEPLNSVVIQDSSLPPNVNEFAEDFVGFSYYGLFDLFSGFDARWVNPKSRPLQAFHTPVGARQQCTLVQGYTNSVQEFQRCVQHALYHVQSFAKNFVDDCGVKGPPTRYGEEKIPGNDQIGRAFYEYAQNVDLTLGAMILAGVTASGHKAILAALKLKIVG